MVRQATWMHLNETSSNVSQDMQRKRGGPFPSIRIAQNNKLNAFYKLDPWVERNHVRASAHSFWTFDLCNLDDNLSTCTWVDFWLKVWIAPFCKTTLQLTQGASWHKQPHSMPSRGRCVRLLLQVRLQSAWVRIQGGCLPGENLGCQPSSGPRNKTAILKSSLSFARH